MPPHNRAPVAILTGPNHAIVRQQVVFDGSASHDPDHPKLASWRLFLSSGAEIQRGKGNAPNAIEWTPELEDVGSVDVLLEVTDRHGITTTSLPVLVDVTLPEPEPIPPLTVTCPDPIEVQADNPDGMVVNYPPPTVSGGVPPYAVDSLPVSGSIFPVGTTDVLVAASDAEGITVNCTFPVVVVPQVVPPPPLSITTTSLSGGRVGSAYSRTIEATGGQQPYTFSLASGSLPGGLSLNASSGVISGTPTTVETASFTIRVTDVFSATATKGFSIAVVAAGAEGPHDYFNELSALSELFIARSLRSQAQLNTLYKGSIQPGGRQITYDFAGDADPRKQDAAKFILPENKVSLQNQDQLDIPFLVSPASGDYLIVWDSWIGSEWSFDISQGGVGPQNIQQYKHFQIRRVGDNITDETRSTFQGVSLPDVAKLTARYYAAAGAPGPNVTDINPLSPQLTTFLIRGERWTRYWLRLQMNVGGYNLHSLWMADEVQPVTQLFNGLQLANFSPKTFQIECNTSSSGRIGPPLVMYFRNVVILSGIGNPVANLDMRRPVAG